MEEDPLAAYKGVHVARPPAVAMSVATETINRSARAEFDSVKGREHGRNAVTDKETNSQRRHPRRSRRPLFGGNVGGNSA